MYNFRKAELEYVYNERVFKLISYYTWTILAWVFSEKVWPGFIFGVRPTVCRQM